MSLQWIYSDPHYYHNNIIKYTSRPFTDLTDMHKTMIKKHNERVHKRDLVFILGDMGFGNKEEMQKIVQQLKGNLILVMGNHDRKRTRKWWLECGFNQVISYPIIVHDFYILSHEPLPLLQNDQYINLHGHLHGNTLLNSQRHINVCVENTNFYPLLLDSIIRSLSNANFS
jgi:calcineurin-like phosphoesterase family protein